MAGLWRFRALKRLYGCKHSRSSASLQASQPLHIPEIQIGSEAPSNHGDISMQTQNNNVQVQISQNLSSEEVAKEAFELRQYSVPAACCQQEAAQFVSPRHNNSLWFKNEGCVYEHINKYINIYIYVYKPIYIYIHTYCVFLGLQERGLARL